MISTLYMAPMLVYTDCIFREVYFRHFSGIDRAVAPFIVVSENSRYRRKAVQGLLPSLHEKVPVEPQILSKDAGAFAALANLLEDDGFTSVNINMACPADTVVNKGRGAGFLPDPQKVDRFLDEVLSRIHLPLSVKVRTGLHSHDEIFPLVDIFNRYPLSEVIIHPRLAVDKYEGPVNLEIMKEVVARSGKPLVFSGDISRRTFSRFKSELPEVNRWMIGRELLRDPFLSEDLRNFDESGTVKEMITPLSGENRDRLRSYLDDLLETFGKKMKRQEALVGKMKSYWQYLASLFPGRQEELNKMRRILHLDEYRLWVDKLLSDKG